jgi:integrase
MTIGSYPPLTVDQARRRAMEVLAGAQLGQDATVERDKARVGDTVNDLCDLWLKEAAHHHRRTGARRSERNIGFDKGRLDAHVRPVLGTVGWRTLNAATSSGCGTGSRPAPRPRTSARNYAGAARVTGGDGAAARTIRTFSSVLAFGVDRGALEVNPAQGVRLTPGRSLNRFLTGEELARLGAALTAAAADGAHPHGLAIIRLLALTGARRNEITALRWREVDFERGLLRLEASKTGAKITPLAPPAIAVLAGLPRVASKGGWVFPAARGEGHFGNVGKVWEDVRERAGLEGVRLHDLRHTFAASEPGAGLGFR